MASRRSTDVQGTLEQQRGARCCRSVLHTHIPSQPHHFTSDILLLEPSFAVLSPKTDQKRQHLKENQALHIRVFSGPGDYPTSDPMADTIPTGPARLAIGCPLDSRGEATVWFGPSSGEPTLGLLIKALGDLDFCICHIVTRLCSILEKTQRSGLAS